MSDLLLNGWAERKKLSPVVIAFFSLPVIFILYQGFGASFLLIFNYLLDGNQVAGMRWSQTISQYVFLLIPVYLLVRLHSSDVKTYTFLAKNNLGWGWILIPLSVITFQPIMQFMSGLERLIPWPSEFLAFRDQIEALLKTMVNADSIPELLWVAFMAALTPAICEEFYFRGYFLRSMSRKFSGKTSVIISGLIFGLFHFNPFQITGLVLMGIYFSFLAWYYKSLWASSVAHFTNNFLVVVAFYLSKGQLGTVSFDDPNLQVPTDLVLISSLIFLAIFVLILKTGKNSSQP